MRMNKIYLLLFIMVNFFIFYITPVMFSFNAAKFPVFYFILRFLLIVIAIFLLPILLRDYIQIYALTLRNYKLKNQYRF